jgi:hypothetical protein
MADPIPTGSAPDAPTQPPRKRRLVPGVSQGLASSYPLVSPLPEGWERRRIPPCNGLDKATIVFELTAGPNEFIRFPEQPFHYKAYFSTINETFLPGGTATQAARYHLYMPQRLENRPQLILNPMLNGRTFVGQTEVTIDSIRLDDRNMDGNMARHWQTVNRTLCSESVRRQKYGDALLPFSARTDFTWTTGRDAVPADGNVAAIARIPSVRSPNLVRLQKNIAFTDQLVNPAGMNPQNPHMGSFGIDGIFPLSCQANPTRMISKQVFDNPYLHPGSRVLIVLHRSTPARGFLDNACTTDEDYYYGDTLRGNHEDGRDQVPEVAWDLTELYLEYESMTITDESRRAAFGRICSTAVWDKPYVLMENIAPNIIRQSLTFPLEPGTKFAALVFMSGHQIKPDSRVGNYMSGRYIFMDRMDGVELSLTGAKGLVISCGGLTKIGSNNDGENTRSIPLKMLHQDMYRQGLINKRFEDWVQEADTGYVDAYEKIIPIDFSLYRNLIDDTRTTNFTVDLTFDAGGSRSNWYCVLFCVQQYLMTYTPGMKWQKSLIL